MIKIKFYKNYNKKIELREDFKPSKLFMAEGDSEAFFLESLFNRRDYSEEEYCIFCFRGIGNLKTALKNVSDEENFDTVSSLGIMIDADNNPQGRLQSVISNLKSINYADDNIPLNGNNIVNYNGKNIGVYISPGNLDEGRIEALTISEIETTEYSACLNILKDCVSEINEVLSNKALTQIYISSKDPTLCGIGRAFEAGILDVEHPVYEQARNIFTNL